jgi:anti-sigma28 factor (negative regulator of flagellin synthesis)
MKIEGHHGQPDCTSVRLDTHSPDRSRAREASVQPGTDRLNLSPDVDIVETAMRAATDAPEIRQDVVARARQKLAAGDLGQDLVRLADRIIDHLVSAR